MHLRQSILDQYIIAFPSIYNSLVSGIYHYFLIRIENKESNKMYFFVVKKDGNHSKIKYQNRRMRENRKP